MYERIREISENSKTFTLFQLNESVFSLEVYLSSFIGSDISPAPGQIDAITGLLRALKTAAKGTASTEQARRTTQGRLSVYSFLATKGGLTAELAGALPSSRLAS